MNKDQLLWGAISFLFVISFFFVKSWFTNMNKDIDGLRLELKDKVTEDTCTERHGNRKKEAEALFKHKHSKPNGEVIIP